MSSIDENLLTCFHCNRRFESPVLLPCNETICSKHVKECSGQKYFDCLKCHESHVVPESGFPSDKKTQQILIFQQSMQKTSFAKLNNLYQRYAELKQNPFFFIQSHFDSTRAQVIECRDKNKKLIDDLFEAYLQETRQLEVTEKDKISQVLNPYPSDDDSNSCDFWRSKIDKLSQQWHKIDEQKLKSELVSLEKKLEKKIANLEQNSMPKNLAIFRGKLLESVELGRFERKKFSRDGPIQLASATSARLLCVAISDHEAKSSEELSVRKGDSLVVKECAQNQWLVSKDDRSGYVSAKMLAETWEEEWFVGKMDRSEAESALKSESNRPGSFLIRFSASSKENQIYSLSVRNIDANIKHYIICRELDKSGSWQYWLLGAKCKFNSIRDLVACHSHKSNGLCTELAGPCITNKSVTTF